AAKDGQLQSWKVTAGDETVFASSTSPNDAKVALARNFEFRLPLGFLWASHGEMEKREIPDELGTGKLRLRFSLWRNCIPADALPTEGWIELELLKEEDLTSV